MKDSRGHRPVLLISCYELGHQPAGIATAAAFLERAGCSVEAIDVSVEGFDEERVKRASFVAISVPMHTALRLGVRVAGEVRRINPQAPICFYGLYAALNSDYLLGTVGDYVIGGEFEEALSRLVTAVGQGDKPNVEGVTTKDGRAAPVLARLPFAVPSRSLLPGLDNYARLDWKGEQRLVGYVEASRGCLHHCTHCPIPPVYGGRFFVMPREVVLEDIRRLVAAGARHITFGDPDFLNGPTHSLRIARALHQEFPELTFDFTAKVEHILRNRAAIGEFGGLGCIFIVSALESLSDEVLAHLEKGHTRADVFEAFEVVRSAGIALRPSFVPFTPWSTIDDYIDMLEMVESSDLIDHVDPVQFTIRLLIPPGSVLLSRPDSHEWLGSLNQPLFTYQWRHPDPRMDELHRKVTELVELAVKRNQDAVETFYGVRELAYRVKGEPAPLRAEPEFSQRRLRAPRLTEAWFC